MFCVNDCETPLRQALLGATELGIGTLSIFVFCFFCRVATGTFVVFLHFLAAWIDWIDVHTIVACGAH